MHAERDWTLVRQAFEEAIERPPAEREAALGRALGARADLLAAARGLLAASASTAHPLDATAAELLGAPGAETVARLAGAPGSPDGEPDATQVDLVGTRIGAHHVRSRISSGGMGEVYLAERDTDGAPRLVALKVLRRGLDSRAMLARFALEQRTLAALRHEHIVGFLDAGALPDGRPWLAMEYVEGLPITEHAARGGLDVRARVRLMLAVAGAVQFAHARLVLHRDLKPSNILVGADGLPKLLDFGVAKLLDDDGLAGASATAATRGMVPITPRYASPEQWRGEPATVATDVFGLGLVLFELLAGRPAEGAGTTLPSERAPAERRRALRGDLDAIVQQALQPAVAGRYASVEALAADLQRWLDDEPVLAHRAPAAERALRWARRHRWPLAAGVLLLVSLGAGLFGTWLGRERARTEASRGWGAHAQARRAALFLGDVLESGESRPWESAAVEARLETELARLPEAEALVRLALGRQALARGAPGPALAHLQRALDVSGDGRGLNTVDLPVAQELLAAARAVLPATQEAGNP